MEGGDSIIGIQFPPGFRFHPTDQELITHYLSKKIGSSLPPASSIIADVDLYKFNPWELPEKAIFGEGEWFFFSPRDRKYPNGVRPNRAAACGYWKATGTDKPILATGGTQCLGVKKALIFYKGRPPKGIKTDWVMHEYRLLESSSPVPYKHKGTMRLDDWVLCRVRLKGALLPENDGEPMQSSPTVFGKAQEHDRQQQQQQVLVGKEGSNLLELSDCQLMGYLLGSASEAESAGESSGLVHGHGFIGAQHQQELVSSMLSSTKRTKLSFGALDELMLVPGKRIFPFSAGEHLSPAESGSEDDGCLEFLL